MVELLWSNSPLYISSLYYLIYHIYYTHTTLPGSHSCAHGSGHHFSPGLVISPCPSDTVAVLLSSPVSGFPFGFLDSSLETDWSFAFSWCSLDPPERFLCCSRCLLVGTLPVMSQLVHQQLRSSSAPAVPNNLVQNWPSRICYSGLEIPSLSTPKATQDLAVLLVKGLLFCMP